MHSLTLKVFAMALAATSACLATGCSSSANDSGNGVVNVQAAGDAKAPANMGEFYKQQKERGKAALEKKGSRP